jgi:hypothetical protein
MRWTNLLEEIRKMRFEKVAAVVGSHMDIIPADDHPPGEGEIL